MAQGGDGGRRIEHQSQAGGPSGSRWAAARPFKEIHSVTAASTALRSLGMGLTHVRRRLEVRYGEAATFDARAYGELYRVVLRFPCESPMASSSLA